MNPWAAIVGRGPHGKREALQHVLEGLRAHAVAVAGLQQEPTSEGGFVLVDLASGERARVARHDERTPDLCSYRFDGAVIERGRGWVARADARVVLLEAGKLEARRAGHWPTIRDVLDDTRPRLAVLCVRPDVLFDVVYGLDDPVAGLELPAAAAQVDAFIDELLAVLGLEA